MVGRDQNGNGVLLTWTGTIWRRDPGSLGTTFGALGAPELTAIIAAATNQISIAGRLGFLAAFDGLSWQRVGQGITSNDWRAGWFDPVARRGVVVGNGGIVLRPTATGVPPPEFPGTNANLLGVSGTNINNVFVVGESGIIYHGNGSSWAQQPSNSSQPLRGVFALDASHVYAVGAGGTLLFNNGNVVGGPGSDPVDGGAMLQGDMSFTPTTDGGGGACGPISCGGGGGGCTCNQTCSGGQDRMLDCDAEGQCTCLVNDSPVGQFFMPQACLESMKAFGTCSWPMP
jgi:hypothetical protein